MVSCFAFVMQGFGRWTIRRTSALCAGPSSVSSSAAIMYVIKFIIIPILAAEVILVVPLSFLLSLYHSHCIIYLADRALHVAIK
jgi:hypothetical protein